MIREKARAVAESFGVQVFKASSGWLEKFRKRHAIAYKSISGIRIKDKDLAFYR